MVKYFCDVCGVELSAEEARHSLDMIGKTLCSEHAREYEDENHRIWKYEKKNPQDSDAIICPHCGKESGYTRKGLMFFLITSDLPCQYCQKIVIYKTNIF
jgi:DNA-directed RNA polymerase subunit RPC12/RpoP